MTTSEPRDYSPIQHVASILSPRLAEWGEVQLVMLTAAFDAGGDEARPILTVAGFVSSAKDWDEFSRLWKERLAVEGIEYFRAVEAAHFRKQFQPWHDNPNKEAWRKQLFSDLMDILIRRVYRKFGCTIINNNFHLLSEENKSYYHFGAYSVAGRTCDKQVREWASENQIRSPIELVFEAGDEGQVELQARILVDTGRAPIFRPKKDTVREDGGIDYGFVPLQAADWLAYELSNATEKHEGGRLGEFRWPLQQFERIHGEPTTYTEKDMEQMDVNLKLNRKITEWAQRIESEREPKRNPRA